MAPKAIRIVAITQEMNRRIDLLLFHSDIRLDLRRVDLVPLIDRAIRRIQITAPDRRYAVDHDLMSLPLMADPIRLASVIENLLDNAVKATSDGGLIRVHSFLDVPHDQAAPLTCACLEIEDDGIGVPADDRDMIFEPGISHFVGGFGLGLALCHEVVEGHAGWIELESPPGKTRFRVMIPQAPPPRDD